MLNFKSTVRIKSINEDLEPIWGKTGEIVGRSEPYDDGTFDWGVFIFDTQEVWQIHESDLTLETL
jgi:hypothetical protein